MRRVFFIAIATLVTWSHSGLAQDATESKPVKTASDLNSSIDKAKRDDIRKLLFLTGAGNLGKQVMTQMIGQFKRQNANIPEAFWKEFSEGISTDDLIELTIPVYDKHLSHDDIKGLIKFYQSPVGKKLIQVQPLIVNDSMQIGARWGQEVAKKAIENLRAKGLVPGGKPPRPAGGS